MRKALWLIAIPIAFLALSVVFDVTKATRRIPDLLSPGERADLVRIEKGARRLTLLRDGRELVSFDVSLGSNPLGHKQREGDGRTPEGRYTIDFANRRSGYHLSLRISYPDHADRANAARRDEPPGSDIMIHGIRNGFGWLGAWHRFFDWTNGCIAVTNAEIEEIWRRVPVGTAVEIKA
jgi:murein L,D-transpeptidase YafK